MLKRKKKTLPTTPVEYPHGTCVKTEKGTYLIQEGKTKVRLRVPTQRILDSWKFDRVVLTTEKALSQYKVYGRLGFRDGSLIYNIADGRIYLISKNKRRHITSPDALDRIGAKTSDALAVSDFEVNLQQEGEVIA